MKSNAPSRTKPAAKALIGLAFLLWAGAWARVVHTHLTSPSPARYLAFVDADGPTEALGGPLCVGPRYLVGAVVWQHCMPLSGTTPTYLRMDLEAKRAEHRWILDGWPVKDAVGLVPLPDGDVAVALTENNPRDFGTRLIQLRKVGGTRDLGRLPARLLALHLEGDHLEAITARNPLQPRHHRRPLDEGEWTTTALTPLPRPPQDDQLIDRHAAIEAAIHGADGWTLWGVQQGADGTTAELWRCPPMGPWAIESLLQLGFSELEFSRTHLDRSAGGVLEADFGAEKNDVFLGRSQDRWAPVERAPPGAGARLLHRSPDLRFAAEGVERIGRWHGIAGEYNHIGGRWLGIRAQENTYAVVDAALPERPGKSIGNDRWLADAASFVPRPEGYIVLGAYGAYVTLDDDLNRTDGLNLFARILFPMTHARRLAQTNTDWRKWPPSNRVIFPTVLLGLPLFLFAGFIVRRRISAVAAVLWMALALALMSRFWEYTGAQWL